LLYAVAGVKADSATWLAAPANGNWSEATNWVGGIVVPGATTGTTNTDTATFGTSSVLAVVADANRNLQNITFGANNTYNLSGGPLLLTTGGKLLANGSSASQNVSAPLTIQGDPGSYTFQTDTPGTNRLMTLSGAVSGVATAANTTILTLDGTSGTNNIINAVISDGTAGGKLAIIKSGTGSWSLATGNTFTGGITVNTGTLRTGNSGNTDLIFGPGTVTMSGGTILLGSTTSTSFINPLVVTTAITSNLNYRGNGNFNPSTMTGTGTLVLGHTASAVNTTTTTNLRDFGGTIRMVANGVNANILRLGSGYVETSMQNAVLDMQANTTLSHQAGTSGTFTTLIGTLTGAAGSFVGASASGGGTIVFSVGGRNEESTFAGVIGNGGTKSALTKVGSAKLTLTGVNTYTGNTSVTGGVLSLSNPCLADTSAVSVNGGVLNLNFVGSDVIASLSLGGSSVSPGIYNSTTPGYEGFITGTGSLRVGLPPLYNEWAASYGLENPWVTVENPALNGEPTGDPDNDGQPNSSEFALGGSPVSGSNNAKIYSLTADSDVDGDTTPELLLTIAVLDGTLPFSKAAAPTATYDGYTYTIEGSLTLDAFTTAATPTTTPVTTGLPAAPVGYHYRTFSLSGSNGLTGKGFLRAIIANP
jgi:autotransporter-associated beta strand protein